MEYTAADQINEKGSLRPKYLSNGKDQFAKLFTVKYSFLYADGLFLHYAHFVIIIVFMCFDEILLTLMQL